MRPGVLVSSAIQSGLSLSIAACPTFAVIAELSSMGHGSGIDATNQLGSSGPAPQHCPVRSLYCMIVII